MAAGGQAGQGIWPWYLGASGIDMWGTGIINCFTRNVVLVIGKVKLSCVIFLQTSERGKYLSCIIKPARARSVAYDELRR